MGRGDSGDGCETATAGCATVTPPHAVYGPAARETNRVVIFQQSGALAGAGNRGQAQPGPHNKARMEMHGSRGHWGRGNGERARHPNGTARINATVVHEEGAAAMGRRPQGQANSVTSALKHCDAPCSASCECVCVCRTSLVWMLHSMQPALAWVTRWRHTHKHNTTQRKQGWRLSWAELAGLPHTTTSIVCVLCVYSASCHYCVRVCVSLLTSHVPSPPPRQ